MTLVCVCMCGRVYMYIYIHVYMCVCVFCVCVCVFCVCVCICIYTYKYTLGTTGGMFIKHQSLCFSVPELQSSRQWEMGEVWAFKFLVLAL